MSRLCNRVTALEKGEGTDPAIEQMWVVVRVRGKLFQHAIRDYANGNKNAFEEMRRQMPEIPEVRLSEAENASIAEDAAEFRRRIATIRGSIC